MDNIKPEHVPINDDFTYDRLVASTKIKGLRYNHYLDYLKSKYSKIKDEMDEEIALVQTTVPWYVDFVNYLAAKVLPPYMTCQQKNKLFLDLKHFYWDEFILFKRGINNIYHYCVPKEEV